MVEMLRGALEEYKHVYVLSFENMRAARFKDVRMDWRESRIYLGKNTVAQVALGRSAEDEFKDNLRHISKRLQGDVGLLMTNRPKAEVLKYFNSFESPEYAKAGAVPMETVTLKAGEILPFQVSMLDQLRGLGLVVEVDDGKVVLRNNFVAAKKNVEITPEQAKLLVHLQKPLIKFKIYLECHWSDGSFEELR
jgi:mRNA turnover protein 4